MSGIPTPKIFETGAMVMENGQTGASQSDGWGGDNSAKTLGAGDAFPYLSFGNKVTPTFKEDESITTKAFKASPRITGMKIDNPISFYARYLGLDRFHYWMFGFENVVKPAVVFRSTSTDPFGGDVVSPGDVYSDGTNDFTFLRTEVTRAESLYIFGATVIPTLSSGTLTGGTNGFVYTSASALMYEHLYELDASGRRYRFYNSAEQTALSLLPTDKRNLMCTLGKRMSNYDLQYQNSMVKDFKFSMKAGDFGTWEGNYVAYEEARGNYGSSDWTLTDGLCDNSKVPTHFESRFRIGTNPTLVNGALDGLVDLGLTEFNMAVGTPLQEIQDYISGLSIAEPVLEDPYSIELSGTISRHTVSTYQDYRNNETKVVAQHISNQGDYMQELLFKEVTIKESGPNDAKVAEEPLSMESSFVCGATHKFQDWVYGNVELQKSPVLFRVRDNNPNNEMVLF